MNMSLADLSTKVFRATLLLDFSVQIDCLQGTIQDGSLQFFAIMLQFDYEKSARIYTEKNNSKKQRSEELFFERILKGKEKLEKSVSLKSGEKWRLYV